MGVPQNISLETSNQIIRLHPSVGYICVLTNIDLFVFRIKLNESESLVDKKGQEQN